MTETKKCCWLIRAFLVLAFLAYPVISSGMVLCIDDAGHSQVELDDGTCCKDDCCPAPGESDSKDAGRPHHDGGLKHVELTNPGLTRSSNPTSGLAGVGFPVCLGTCLPSVDFDRADRPGRSPVTDALPGQGGLSTVGITVLIC